MIVTYKEVESSNCQDLPLVIRCREVSQWGFLDTQEHSAVPGGPRTLRKELVHGDEDEGDAQHNVTHAEVLKWALGHAGLQGSARRPTHPARRTGAWR